MKPDDRFEELESLLLDWEDGTLDDAGVARVREILRTNEDARAHYVRLQMINAVLKCDDDAGLIAPTGHEPGSHAHQSVREQHVKDGLASVAASWRPRRWMLAVAALVICVLTGRLIQLELAGRPVSSGQTVADTDHRDESDEATSQGVALVTRLVDVTWGEDQNPLEVGDALPPGRLALVSGYAQIEFFCGATVILEGPAELDLQSPLLARVRSGKLRVQVPPAARGFSLEIDDLKVVDLGTEFGLSVSPEGANVQVFDGEVELQQPGADKLRLTTGEALVRTADGAYEETEVTPDSFLDIATLESWAQGQRDDRYERWRVWSEEFRRDERLIAYYAFDQKDAWQRRLNSSLEPANRELDGAIVGAQRVPGRWPSKGSLEFKRPGDRVRVQIPGEYSSLTFSCWVKIDSLDRWYNSLFLTDNYNQGEPHWQILDTGQLFFSVRVKDDDNTGPEHRKVLSPPFWTPSLSGKWLHLATTFSVAEKRVTHYLNAEVLHTESIPDNQLVRTTRFGRSTIGNWSSPQRPDAHFAIRNLNGRIDEFAILAAALTANEIKEIYTNGKP
jgi:hypothetical protein